MQPRDGVLSYDFVLAPVLSLNEPDNAGALRVGTTATPFPGEIPGTDDNGFAVGARMLLERNDATFV